jgi:NAD(P)-dependent dehydrogenase (short-subunit alcohol dehydrogenase family)
MSQDFAGKTALITGSTSGIGRQVATQFAGRGAHVIITGRDKVRGEEIVATITSNGGRADFVEVELGDIASVRSLSRRALEIGGGHVDILVNNAGLFPFAPTANVPVEEFGAVMDGGQGAARRQWWATATTSHEDRGPYRGKSGCRWLGIRGIIAV